MRVRMSKRPGAWFVLAGLLLAGFGVSYAQDEPAETPTEQEDEYFETVEVNVVNVEVFVTDKKGNPITGLTKDDFEIFEDKRPIAVTNFYAVEDRRRLGVEAPVAPEAEPRLPSASRAEVPLIPVEDRLHLVIYIDNFNIRPFNRNRVFRRLRTFLRQNLNPQDQVMLVSYDRSLHMRQEFTNQPSKINAAMFELEDFSGHGVTADSERRRVLDAVGEAEDVGDAMLQVRPYAEALFNDISFSLSALEDMIDSLAGLSGRKAILYVSDGLPMKAAEEMFYMVQQKFQYTPAVTQMLDFDNSRRFRTLAHNANSNGVTFYAIDAAGLRASEASSVEISADGGGIEGMSTYIDTIYRQNIQEPLRFMADLTGGRAILNSNDISDDLLRIKKDFDNYYSLGYSPANAGEGRLHKIQVKVKGRKGLRIRHRESYRSKSPSTQMIDGTLAALRYGFEDNSLGVLLEIGSPTPSRDGMFMVPVKVGIPLNRVVMVPRAETYYGRTRLYFGAIDDEERISEVTDLELPIRIPADRFAEVKEMFYPYETSLLMRGGPHQLAVGLRDELGSTTSYVTRTFYVGSR